jgi:hypothetical protein
VCSKYILKKQFRLHTKLHDGADKGEDLDTSREEEEEEEEEEEQQEQMVEESDVKRNSVRFPTHKNYMGFAGFSIEIRVLIEKGPIY